MTRLRLATIVSMIFWCLCLAYASHSAADPLKQQFVSPPDAARPWVYWYFMDGNQTRAGIQADLEAMKKAGIGGVIPLYVNIGIPQGPVDFMSEEWQQQFVYAVSEAKRLGLQVALGSGPGWCGTGGPWITPDLSMQHLVAAETTASGPSHFDGLLSRPQPRLPFFGEDTLVGGLHQAWADFYRDEYVIAYPTPLGTARLSDPDDKALYYRSSYSSMGATPRLPPPVGTTPVPPDQCIALNGIVDLTGKMGPDGRLSWDVPPGNWTILRLGRTATGQTTRPAPTAGLGFESDKFSRAGLTAQFQNYEDKLLQRLGPQPRVGDSGLTMLHFDSWEMGSQNWSAGFRQDFLRRCGYDPLPYLPAMTGHIVGSPEQSERFLWDLRQTASDVLIQNHGRYLAEYAHAHGMTLSMEPYDLNPSADLDLGSVADLPMGEFWSKGWALPSEYSCYEAVSVGHTNGRPVIGAESFTASPGEDWQQYPGSMKAQLDWALCDGINKIVIHRYQHQPDLDKFPGMTMGPYGVHWERTETWWDMVRPFHTYIARCSQMLRQGLPVADLLYLTPEGAPQVFTPPPSALLAHDGLPDRRGYNFDGCSPENLIAHVTVKQGRLCFPDGMSYTLLVLPKWETMTPNLLGKIVQLVRAGATVVGTPPHQSPSLIGYPACDTQVQRLAAQLWGEAPYAAARTVGKGRVLLSSGPTQMQMDQAKWIWFPEGDPTASAPVGTRYFAAALTLPAGRAIQTATAEMTADNTYTLSINGHLLGGGSDFHHADRFDIKPWLKSGLNQLRVTVVNSGETPNPAGLIGAFAVAYRDGTVQRLFTDARWQVAQSAGGPAQPAREVADLGGGPWHFTDDTNPLYPDYFDTAAQLGQMGQAPDFSAGAPMRYIHRRLPEGEFYFIANAGAQPVATTCTFRVSGHTPEWWNPLTGETRALTASVRANGLTCLPVRLAPFESGFVVFRTPLPARRPLGHPNRGADFPQPRTVMTLTRPWSVAFDPRWGGPAAVTFPALTDWSKRPEPGVKYYSGKAVYRTSFALPPGVFPTARTYFLGLGTVDNLASVRLNGHDLGILWCAPWRVAVPAGILRPIGNRLEVTVANLWINRLIGDSNKPQSERLTSTTVNNYTPASALQPSGLLGPVTLAR